MNRNRRVGFIAEKYLRTTPINSHTILFVGVLIRCWCIRILRFSAFVQPFKVVRIVDFSLDHVSTFPIKSCVTVHTKHLGASAHTINWLLTSRTWFGAFGNQTKSFDQISIAFMSFQLSLTSMRRKRCFAINTLNCTADFALTHRCNFGCFFICFFSLFRFVFYFHFSWFRALCELKKIPWTLFGAATYWYIYSFGLAFESLGERKVHFHSFFHCFGDFGEHNKQVFE